MPFDAKPPHFLAGRGRLCPGLRPAQSEKVMAQFFRICSDRSQKKTRFGENEPENAAKIKHRLQPCRSAQQSVIIEFSLALSEWFYNNISDTRP